MLALLRELTAMFRAGIGDSTRISSVSGVIPSIVPNETYGEVISVLAACKTLASIHVAVEAPPRRVTARSAKNIKRDKVPHKLSRGRDASREPLRRMRPVGVVPPAVRVPAEAVALGLY